MPLSPRAVPSSSLPCLYAQALASHFDLHPLAVEDCIHLPQRIKVDFYGGAFVYCSLTLASLSEPSRGGRRRCCERNNLPGGGSDSHSAAAAPHVRLSVVDEVESCRAGARGRVASDAMADVARLTHAIFSTDERLGLG